MRHSIAAALATSAILLGLAAPAAAQPPETSVTSTPFTTPNTDNCPNRTSPPPAIDSSEVPEPGRTVPSPAPVPADAVGGPELDACGVVTATGTPPLPADISATAWVLSDLDTGDVIAAKDPHGRYRPASTIKTLLALVALKELDLNASVTGTAEDAQAEGSAVGIGKGGVYTIRQLMQGLVMASGNDAAHAIAVQLGGVDVAVQKMNDEAAALGALDTRVVTPSGLDGPGMSCSAYDLALIFRAAIADPTFAQLISTESVPFPGYPKDPAVPDDKDHPGFTLASDNQLLYNYDGALGGKNGYTDDARQTFVGGAQKNGRRLAVSVMDADVLPIRPWEQVARLLDYGFALPAGTSVGTLVDANSVSDRAVTKTATPSSPTSTAVPNRPLASGSDSADGDLAVRVGVGIVALIAVGGLLTWARKLSRR
ncbi:putative penicillin-binding protein DacB1 [Rhodococcoides trifolii]|uniref:Penicillin-binding protein DacB1 n=1 Tax=Rhodococcoides trifolii TaxID=908250 RepID=A0A917FY39_9NOCA|nr:D-alanyl-D-alanine carboxypeptidase family protein [Rhodococcus trifolii]GGG13556.1 putative penicillin-binding protein DacB1 [Rhodococcus trifolii]